MDTIRAFFSPKLGHFFPIFGKGKGRPPPLPPSSYAPTTFVVMTFFKMLSDSSSGLKFPPDFQNTKK